MIDDPYSDEPDDKIWTSTENDVSSGDDNTYQFIITEQTKTADGFASGSSFTYSLEADYETNAGNFDMEENAHFADADGDNDEASFLGKLSAGRRSTGYEATEYETTAQSFGFNTTVSGIVIR